MRLVCRQCGGISAPLAARVAHAPHDDGCPAPQIDKDAPLRRSHENASIHRVYSEFLGQPGGEVRARGVREGAPRSDASVACKILLRRGLCLRSGCSLHHARGACLRSLAALPASGGHARALGAPPPLRPLVSPAPPPPPAAGPPAAAYAVHRPLCGHPAHGKGPAGGWTGGEAALQGHLPGQPQLYPCAWTTACSSGTNGASGQQWGGHGRPACGRWSGPVLLHRGTACLLGVQRRAA